MVLEQVGAHVAPAPILGQLVALEFLADTEWAPALLAGEPSATVAPRLGDPTPYAPEADVVVVAEGDRLCAVDLRGAAARPPSRPWT